MTYKERMISALERRRCFQAAGTEGWFMLSLADHFFEAGLLLLEAFANGARRCVY